MTRETGQRDLDGTPILDERTTTTARITLRTDGIARVTMLAGHVQTPAQALENMAVMREMSGGQRHCVLVDIRDESRGDKAALDVYADPKQNPLTIAAAVLLDSPMSMVMGNFFLRINRPKTPTRLFTSEQTALAWLHEQLAAARVPP